MTESQNQSAEHPSEPPVGAATTPTSIAAHGRIERGVGMLPTSSFAAGRFGRMFRNLPVFQVPEGELQTIIDALSARIDIDVDAGGGWDPSLEHPSMPAGYTYLGQFIDHDITFDPISSLQRQNDPDALHNFRSPKFDLDSIYGRGPADQPYLYRSARDPIIDRVPGVDVRGIALSLGETVSVDPSRNGPDLPETPMVAPSSEIRATTRTSSSRSCSRSSFGSTIAWSTGSPTRPRYGMKICSKRRSVLPAGTTSGS